METEKQINAVEPKYMRVKEFCKYIGMGRNRAMDVANKSGAVVRAGVTILIDKSAFDRYAEGRKQLL